MFDLEVHLGIAQKFIKDLNLGVAVLVLILESNLWGLTTIPTRGETLILSLVEKLVGPDLDANPVLILILNKSKSPWGTLPIAIW